MSPCHDQLCASCGLGNDDTTARQPISAGIGALVTWHCGGLAQNGIIVFIPRDCIAYRKKITPLPPSQSVIQSVSHAMQSVTASRQSCDPATPPPLASRQTVCSARASTAKILLLLHPHSSKAYFNLQIVTSAKNSTSSCEETSLAERALKIS